MHSFMTAESPRFRKAELTASKINITTLAVAGARLTENPRARVAGHERQNDNDDDDEERARER